MFNLRPYLLAPKFSIITTLHLRGNKLGDREAKILCDALVLNTTVTYMDVSVNAFSDKVGRCRLTISKHVLKAPMFPALETII